MPCRLCFGDSLDLTPPVLTHPAVSTRLVRVNGNWLGGSVAVAWWTNPVILVLMRRMMDGWMDGWVDGNGWRDG